MNVFDYRNHPEPRIELRILAGILAGFTLLICLPTFVRCAIGGPWYFWFSALNSLLIGIGFLGAARTGQFFRFRKRSCSRRVDF
jgi:hypothetical protein